MVVKKKAKSKAKGMIACVMVLMVITLCAFPQITKGYSFFQRYFGDYVCGYSYGAVQMASLIAPVKLIDTDVKVTAQVYDYCWAHQTAVLGIGYTQVSEYKRIAADNQWVNLPFIAGFHAVQGNPLYLMIASDNPTVTDYVDGFWQK